MAQNSTSQSGRKTFQAAEQPPDPNNRSTILEMKSLVTAARPRTFITTNQVTGEDVVTTARSKQPVTGKYVSKTASYSRFLWFDSRAAATSGQAFQPPKRRRLEKVPREKVRLNAKRPLKIAFAVNEDVWRVILSFCDPRLLLSMRYISRMFRDILKESRIWKESREAYFGEDMPDCPFFLTESGYTDLLVGSGCQNRQCLRRETRKANWIFRGRLCEDCLRQSTRTDFSLGDTLSRQLCPDLFANPQRLNVNHLSYLDLIPTAYHESGKYYAPRRIDSSTGKWYGVSHRTHGLLYLKSDYEKLMQELTTMKHEEWSLDRMVAWASQKYEVALMYGRVAEDMLHWEPSRTTRWDQLRSRARSEVEREVFFIQKAAELPDPIAADLLPFFAAYQSALLTMNKPSERSWQLLLPKILPYREEAEKVKQYQEIQPRCHIRNAESDWSEDAKLFMELHDHRHVSRVETGRWTPEQTFVRRLGQVIFKRFYGNVADEDLVLICLREIHDSYQQLTDQPHGLNYDGTHGVYKLSLDDARMIVEDIIQPELDRKTLRSVAVLRSFRCAGCTRAGVARKFTFRSCFEHIRAVHSVRVGKDLAFSRYARNFVSTMSTEGLSTLSSCSVSGSNFPWYIVEWTKTLPVLPQYADVNKLTRWDPDSDQPYMPRPIQNNATNSSLFHRRSAVTGVKENENNFRDAFVAAVKAFEPTDLDTASVVKVALRYALDLHNDSAGILSREEFFEHLKAARDVNPRLVFKFKCGLCSRRPSVDKHVRCARTPVEITRLYSHWHQKHKGDNYDMVKDFLDLPSDLELLQTMEKHDQELSEMQMKSRERETVELSKTYRKKPDHKAVVLMNRPICRDIFDRLFPLDHAPQEDLINSEAAMDLS